MAKEQDTQRKIQQALKKKKGWCCKTITCNINGVPDILSVIPVKITEDMIGQTLGVFHAVEVKTPKGVVSPIQDYQISKIREAGGVAFVARSVEDFLDNSL